MTQSIRAFTLCGLIILIVGTLGPAAAHNIMDLNHKSSAESHDGVAYALAPFCADVRVVLCENVFALSVADEEAYASADVVVSDYRSSGNHYLESTLWSGEQTGNSGSWLISYRGAYQTVLSDKLHSWKELTTCEAVCTDSMFMTLAAETDIDFDFVNYYQTFIRACNEWVCVGGQAAYEILDGASDSRLVEANLDVIEITDPSGLDVLDNGPDTGHTIQITLSDGNRVFTSSGGHPLYVDYEPTTKVWSIYEYR